MADWRRSNAAGSARPKPLAKLAPLAPLCVSVYQVILESRVQIALGRAIVAAAL